MHILAENNLIYIYDNNNYYKTKKESDIDNYIIEYNNFGPKNNITLEKGKFYLSISKLNCIEVIDYFELNFPNIYNTILEKSGNINQLNVKLMTDGVTFTMGNKLDYVFAIQLIKTWYYKIFSNICIPFLNDRLYFFSIDINNKWKLPSLKINITHNIIPIKEL